MLYLFLWKGVKFEEREGEAGLSSAYFADAARKQRDLLGPFSPMNSLHPHWMEEEREDGCKVLCFPPHATSLPPFLFIPLFQVNNIEDTYSSSLVFLPLLSLQPLNKL